MSCTWTPILSASADGPGECVTKEVRWCAHCGAIEVFIEGDYTWERITYAVGKTEPVKLTKTIKEVLAAPHGSCFCTPKGKGTHVPDCRFR